MKTIRSFLAVRLDLENVRRIFEAEQRVRNRCERAGLKIAWVPPPNMHITMRFLGQITEPMAYALKEMIEVTTRDCSPFEIEVRGLGAFPSLEEPKVIWAGLGAGSEKLLALHAAVACRLTAAGFKLDDKPFKSHVTIGRLKSGNLAALPECLAEDGDAPLGITVVRNLYCYRSDLQPQGAEYHCLWRLPFGGAYQPTSGATETADRDMNGAALHVYEDDEAFESTATDDNDENENIPPEGELDKVRE